MSTQLSSESKKQPPSVYTVMLLLSMLFMLIAVIAMYIEYQRWAPEYYRTNSTSSGMVIEAEQGPSIL